MSAKKRRFLTAPSIMFPIFFFSPAFSPSSPHFWPTGQTADSFMADRERREDLSPNRMKKEVGGGMMGDDVS